MGSITSGVGLVSGLDYQSIVDQLISIDARPRDTLLTRVGTIDAQRTAYLDISARITALLSRADFLTRSTSFTATKASSSLSDVLSATSGPSALPGSYNFVVRALAATHQFVSRGFHSKTAPISTGSFTIESGQARVNHDTGLDELNGHTGIRRGSFELIDSTGEEATVNIATAVTVGDVVDEINAAGVGVRATVTGDGFVLTDTAGGSGGFRVREVNGGRTAEDLGFGPGNNYDSFTGRIDGTSVMFLAETTALRALNDGLGLRHSVIGTDFTIMAGPEASGVAIDIDLSDIIQPGTRLARLNHGQGVRLGQVQITSRDSTMTTVDLSGAETINDVKQALQGAFGDSRISIVMSGSRLVISDATDISELEDSQISSFTIEDLSGYAANDLGIAGEASSTSIQGDDIIHMDTLADAINAITYAAGNEDADRNPLVVASISADGHGIMLHNQSAGPTAGPLTIRVAAGADTYALDDLGLRTGTYYAMGGGAIVEGNRILGSLNSVLLKTLNGGQGLAGGTIHVEANGNAADINLAGAETLSEVIDRLNDAAGLHDLGIEAGYDSTGTRLAISNVTGSGNIFITDVGDGTFAADAGLDQPAANIRGANLQRQYISTLTSVDDLNSGHGIARGRVKFTNSLGTYATLDLSSTAIQTMQDVIDAIDTLGIGIEARINDTGDGLLITDTNGGASDMLTEEEGNGTTARDLNILGTADSGQIDGSYEFHLDVGGTDTLTSLADRIGSETTLATANLLNDGSEFSPYRLNITSLMSGSDGELIIDDGDVELGITTLTRAQNARVFYGSSAESGILLTSSSNTFDNVVAGVSLTASSVSDDPVTITVNRDLDQLIANMAGLVEGFNDVVDRISAANAYDADNEILGILQGESALRTVDRRLHTAFTGTMNVLGSPFTHLSQVGIKGRSGGKLTFDEDKFREAYAANPEGVTRFFTDEDNGVGVRIKGVVDDLTDGTGIITARTDALATRKTLLNDRVDMLNERLEAKRARLLRQFMAMESALGEMQSQQVALNSLAALLPASSA